MGWLGEQTAKEATQVRKERQARVHEELMKKPFLVRATLGVPISWYLQWKMWREHKAAGGRF